MVDQTELLANSMLLARIAELDTDKNQRQIQDELAVMMEEERLLGDAPVVPRVQSLEEQSVERQSACEAVRGMFMAVY